MPNYQFPVFFNNTFCQIYVFHLHTFVFNKGQRSNFKFSRTIIGLDMNMYR